MSELSSTISTRALGMPAPIGGASSISIRVSMESSDAAGCSGSQRSTSSTYAWARVAADAAERVAPISGEGTWAVPKGSETVKVVPWPSWLCASMAPPCSLTSSCTSARPMPEPSNERLRWPSTR